VTLYNSYYMAAPSELQTRAKEFALILRSEGLFCTSRWMSLNLSFDAHGEPALVQFAQDDLADVEKARILVALNPSSFRYNGTGGRHVELGAALAWDKHVFLVGERTNIFHYHPNVHVLKDDDFVEAARVISQYAQEVERGRSEDC